MIWLAWFVGGAVVGYAATKLPRRGGEISIQEEKPRPRVKGRGVGGKRKPLANDDEKAWHAERDG